MYKMLAYQDLHKCMLLLFSQGKSGALDKVDWMAWFNGVGMPPVKPE